VNKPPTKPVTFVGSSLDDLRDFPQGARRETGYQLDKVQNGEEPASWKPMSTVGSGAHEIRIRDDSGAFRLLYVAKFPKRSTCCMRFRKRRARLPARIYRWPKSAIKKYDEEIEMKTFANVWDAIEDSQTVAASMKARAQLMRALQKAVTTWDLSQKASADRLGVTQPRLNDLLRGKIDKFSLDALFDLTARVGLKVSIALRKAA
jgi:phage-related protein/predicted XRE-type DNA-binding protein